MRHIRLSIKWLLVGLITALVVVPAMAQEKTDLTAKEKYGRTALMRAAMDGDAQRVKELIASKVNIQTADFWGMTAIMYAAGSGNIDCVNALIQAGANVRVTSQLGLTTIEAVVYPGTKPSKNGRVYGVNQGTGNPDCITALVKAHANPNVPDRSGFTPLMWAASRGLTDCVRVLLDSGAKVNSETSFGITALEMSVATSMQYSESKAVFSLMSHMRSEYGGIPEGAAAIETVKSLLDAGADVNRRDDAGCTPLIMAAAAGKLDCVKILLAAHADVNAKDGSRRTALEFAVFGEQNQKGEMNADFRDSQNLLLAPGGHAEVAQTLIQAGADVNAKDRRGMTPVLEAVLNGNVDCLKLLLAAGGDASAKDGRGKSALQLSKTDAISDLLRKAGAKE